jgi:hypothetical protein
VNTIGTCRAHGRAVAVPLCVGVVGVVGVVVGAGSVATFAIGASLGGGGFNATGSAGSLVFVDEEELPPHAATRTRAAVRHII